MASTIIKKASVWRAKYIEKASSSPSARRTAVVVGSTSGIGKAVSHRLAQQGWKVVAVGRHREGRAEAVVQELTKLSPETEDGPKHSFVACDAFSLGDVKKAADDILKSNKTIDALVMTQGMATTQGFTPTIDGNDEKLTLHYFSRMAFANLLLPALRESSMPRGAVVMSILSGGVHGPYAKYKEHFSLENNYSIKNAADAAGYYNDLGLDVMAKANPTLNFVHAAPGFVNTNWGTEFNPVLRAITRCLQPLGRNPADCAEFMLGPTVFASAYDEDPSPSKSSTDGVIIMGDKGETWKLTENHTSEALDSVWKSTVEVLTKAGIEAAI